MTDRPTDRPTYRPGHREVYTANKNPDDSKTHVVIQKKNAFAQLKGAECKFYLMRFRGAMDQFGGATDQLNYKIDVRDLE